jgi:hypothetical protein
MDNNNIVFIINVILKLISIHDKRKNTLEIVLHVCTHVSEVYLLNFVLYWRIYRKHNTTTY